MERIDIRDMNAAKAQNLALKIFKNLRPNEALVVISDSEPKVIYDMLKDREDYDKDGYEVQKKAEGKYVGEFLKER